MFDWTAQTWIAFASAWVSVLGALVSVYWARRRMIWDAGRELGALRRDALTLIWTAKTLDHKTWSVGVRRFQVMRAEWERAFLEKQPLMKPQARKAMEELELALGAAEEEVFGRVRVFSSNEEEDPDVDGQISEETTAKLTKAERRLSDPLFLAR